VADTYTVERGDTLSHIATAHGQTLQELLALNPTIADPNKISVGQRVNIPEAAPSPASAPTNRRTGDVLKQHLADLTRAQIHKAEDFRANAYPDPEHGREKPTTGFGTTRMSPGAINYLKSIGKDPDKVFTIGKGGQSVSRPQAIRMADIATGSFIDQLRKAYPNFDSYPEPSQVAMIEMAYQLGVRGMVGFNNMTAALRAPNVNWDTVANEGLDSRWGRRYNTRATRVTNQLRSGKDWTPPAPPPTPEVLEVPEVPKTPTVPKPTETNLQKSGHYLRPSVPLCAGRLIKALKTPPK